MRFNPNKEHGKLGMCEALMQDDAACMNASSCGVFQKKVRAGIHTYATRQVCKTHRNKYHKDRGK